MSDDKTTEFDEDAAFPIKIQPCKTPTREIGPQYTYTDGDIDRISTELGIP